MACHNAKVVVVNDAAAVVAVVVVVDVATVVAVVVDMTGKTQI